MYLHYHAEICQYLARIYYLAATDDMDAAREELDKMEIYLSQVEMDIHEGFDLFLFDRFVRGILRVKSVRVASTLCVIMRTFKFSSEGTIFLIV